MADDAPVMEIELAMAIEQASSAVASLRSGVWGSSEKGQKAVTNTCRWIGSRYASGTGPVDVGQAAVASGQDLAYTVGFERGPVSIDGGPVREMAMRVTQVYRRVDGGWKLVHRHADLAPPDHRIPAL
jgi:ketosteroid isomerase-like protein